MAETRRTDELRRRVQMDPASIAFAALAEECRRAGLIDEAIATCRTGLKRHPNYLSARVTLGRALADAGRHDEAQAEFELVLRTAPENLAALRGLSEIHGRRDPGSPPVPAQDALPAVVDPVVEPDPAPSSPPDFVAPPDRALVALEAFMGAIQQARNSGASLT